MSLKNFPKVELHVHLDGSVRLETLKEILSLNLTLEDVVAPLKCDDLNEYLTKFYLPIKGMQTKENLRRIARELACDLKEDGVIYAEIRFAPINHVQNLSLDEVIEGVLDGLRKVDIKTNLILCLMRNSSFDDNKKIIELAYKYLGNGVCALDLAGAEGLYKTSNFADLFKIAKNLNIPFTIHAGEADGSESIKCALNMGAKRIGHGIRCTEDREIVDLIKQKKIVLEVCPTSNVQTNVVTSYENHPIKYLYDEGILVTINTDNRTVSNITLTKEYEKLMTNFNFTLEDIKKMNIWAIQNSFLQDKEKDNLLLKYKELTNNN